MCCFLLPMCGLFSCVDRAVKDDGVQKQEYDTYTAIDSLPYILVLGNTQDAGSPQIGCTKACCKDLFAKQDYSRKVVSLGLVDPLTESTYLFDASPDLVSQVSSLSAYAGFDNGGLPDGIFVSHAHIGHYTGLMYMGRESLNADAVPVYMMPRMQNFIESNGPWSQLVALKNIEPRTLHVDSLVSLGNVEITCFLVPHRDEFSETVGFRIQGPNKSAIFIPDIDKWQKWDTNIVELIREVDYAFLDATFFDGKEVPNRNLSEIPHPFVVESMALFSQLSTEEKSRIYFIHFNHTNPLLNKASKEYKEVISRGFNISSFLDRVQL